MRLTKLRHPAAFTLVELLVVMLIIVVLVALSVPALSAARATSKQTICASQLRQVGIAIYSYANDYKGSIPFGPKAPPAIASNFYPATGNVTSLVSLGYPALGQPVGLGLLIESYLANQPKVLFCPDPDSYLDTDKELLKVGVSQAQCSYYYRHASVTALSEPNPPPVYRTRLGSLGVNSNGLPIRALVMDTQFLCHPGLAAFGITPRTHHKQAAVSILFADAHAQVVSNLDNAFTVDITNQLYASFQLMLDAFERADAVQ
ncbi:MAG: prepilin-type N-terminal cleavage/methylation domain-containing protein [Planctomycetes bacterium]|nr:prepilin-type N-terminal cleavage/methylation domain-containing protein [Planctomycetota bacterium]